jgi:hypothetical protein
MWGIEECAWTIQCFRNMRFTRWVDIMSLTVQRMLFGGGSVPSWIVLLSPSFRQLLLSIKPESRLVLLFWILLFAIGRWIRVVLREVFVRFFVLGSRKHMQKPGWSYWILLSFFPVVEPISCFIFVTCATWAMLWRAFQGNTSIVYVVAPKAFHEEGTKENQDSKIHKKAK